MAGKFGVQRDDKKSSLMALDQSQELCIQFLKEDSGAKGLYGQQESKEVIELFKPEVLRAIDEFECACFSASTPNESLEHPTIGKNMLTEFVTDRIQKASKPLSDVIKNPTCTHSQTDHQRI